MVSGNAGRRMESLLRSFANVEDVRNLEIHDRFLSRGDIDLAGVGTVSLGRIDEQSAPALYEFYFDGLSEEARIFFPPYPLFSPPVGSPAELGQRIQDWSAEDDWTVLDLTSDGQVVAIGLLKRFKTDRPTSGLAVRESFQKKGIGRLLQTLINEQARLLGLETLYVTLAEDNVASLKLHMACGFTKTENRVPHYVYRGQERYVDRWDIEMILEV